MTTADTSDERLAALVENYSLMPEAMQRALATQAQLMREHEAGQAENVARLEKRHERLLSVNDGLGRDNAQLNSRVEILGAENATFREEIEALRAENLVLREEQEAFAVLEAALEQFSAKKRMAIAAMGADGQDKPEHAVQFDAVPIDPAVEQVNQEPAKPRMAPSPAVRAAADLAETQPMHSPELEVVFRLPAVLLAQIDQMIDSGQWASRDSFARAALAEAVEAGLPAPTGLAPARARLMGSHRQAARRGVLTNSDLSKGRRPTPHHLA